MLSNVLKLQACMNVPASTLPFMHALLFIIVRHSHPFLLIHLSIYLSCYILHLCSHSCGLMLLHTYLYILPQCLHHLRHCHIPLQRLRWAPALICYIIFFTYFVPSICYLLGTNILPYSRHCHIPVQRLSTAAHHLIYQVIEPRLPRS